MTLFIPMLRMDKLSAPLSNHSVQIVVLGHEKRRSIVLQEMNLYMMLCRFFVVKAGMSYVKGC